MKKDDNLTFLIKIVLPLTVALSAGINYFTDLKMKSIQQELTIIREDVRYTKKNLQYWLTIMQSYHWSDKNSEQLKALQNVLEEILEGSK